MLDHLLLPLDGSQLAECVLSHAVGLAQSFGAHVTLLRVVEGVSDPGQPRSIDPMTWHIGKAEAQAYLEGWVTRFDALGIPAQAALVEGSAAERVIEYAHAKAVDLVILSSHGRSGLTGWNISSVVQKIVLRIYRPILIVRAYQGTPAPLDQFHYQRLLVLLDGTQRAECVLPWASSLAEKHGAQLILMHVVRQPDLPRHVPLTADEQALLEQLVECNRLEGLRYLEQLKARLPGTIETRLVISPKVTSALYDVAQQEQIDLILLSAHCYSADTRWPYGSEIITLLAYGDSSMLIMPDVPADTLEPSQAETAIKSHGGH